MTCYDGLTCLGIELKGERLNEDTRPSESFVTTTFIPAFVTRAFGNLDSFVLSFDVLHIRASERVIL